MSELKVTASGVKILTSLDENVYDSEVEFQKKTKQKKLMSKTDREARSKKRIAEKDLSSSESEAETATIYDRATLPVVVQEWKMSIRTQLKLSQAKDKDQTSFFTI